MPSQKPQSHAPIAATLAAVVLSWGLAFGGAYVADAVWGVDAWDHHVPVSAVIVLASVVSLAVVCLWRRSALASASLAMLGWFPLLLLNCFWVLGEPLTRASHVSDHMPPLGSPAWDTGISIAILFGVSVPVARAVVRRRLGGPIRFLAVVAAAIALGLLAASLRRLPNPSPHGYIATVPVVAMLRGDADTFAGPGFSVKAGWGEKPWCLVSSGGNPDYPVIFPTCKGLLIRHGAGDLWFIQDREKVIGIRAASGGAAVETTIYPDEVAASLGPPRSWIGLAAAGGAGALLVLGLGEAARRRTRGWRGARAGVHDGSGWITFKGGDAPLHVPAAGGLPKGRILVDAACRTAHYREMGCPAGEEARVAPGTLRQMQNACDARSRGLAAFALLLAALSVAPLVASAYHGLL